MKKIVGQTKRVDRGDIVYITYNAATGNMYGVYRDKSICTAFKETQPKEKLIDIQILEAKIIK